MTLTADQTAHSEPSAEVRVERLYVRHHRSVYRWAMRYTAGDSALAEDVVQEVFVRLLDAVDNLRDDDDLGGWLYRVTANRCLSILQRQKVRSAILRTLGRSESRASGLDERLDARESLTRVFEAMQQMPPKERIVFSMLHLDELRQSEIAAALGYSKGYVCKLVRRATQRVEAIGYEVPDGE